MIALVVLFLVTRGAFDVENKPSVLTTSSAPNPKLRGTWFSGSSSGGSYDPVGFYDTATRQWQGKALADGWTYQLNVKDDQYFSFFVHYQDPNCVASSVYVSGRYEVKDNLLILLPETFDKTQKSLSIFCEYVGVLPFANVDKSPRPSYFYRFRFTGDSALELTTLHYNSAKNELEVDPENPVPIILTPVILMKETR
jgi:hypothetical protein